MGELFQKSALDLHDLIESREVSVEEVVRSHVERIEDTESRLSAFVARDVDRSLRTARDFDRRLASGETPGPLFGIPLAVKDNICTRGLTTTCASAALHSYEPPYDATAIARLHDAGTILLGKTNMDEFGMGSSTEHSCFGPTRNPWDTERVPGGSSGGSAAAVAALNVPVALGSDTGGSVRQPASYCGLVGLKPTYGRVSRYGLVAFASSLEQIGVLTRTVGDCAAVLSVIAGYDDKDSTCVETHAPPYPLPELEGSLKIGIPEEYLSEETDKETVESVGRALRLAESLGHTLVPVSLPHTRLAVATYYTLADAEASTNLARYDGVRYGDRAACESVDSMYKISRSSGFGNEVKRRILLGTYVLRSGYYKTYYKRAQQIRYLIKRDFDDALDNEVDVICSPTCPGPAFKLGEKIDSPLEMYLTDLYTISASLAGLPALSIPCGLTSSGLPLGLQITGRAFEEGQILALAKQLEKAIEFPELDAVRD